VVQEHQDDGQRAQMHEANRIRCIDRVLPRRAA